MHFAINSRKCHKRPQASVLGLFFRYSLFNVYIFDIKLSYACNFMIKVVIRNGEIVKMKSLEFMRGHEDI